MANVNTKAHVLVRDAFICRTCGRSLILAQPVKVLDWHTPGLELYDLHGSKEPLRTRGATVDHLIPEAEGGMDVLENLVACCVTCNSRKGGKRTEAPRPRAGVGQWDGLSSLFLGLAPQYADRLTKEDHKWLAALQREGIQPRADHTAAVAECLQRMKADDTFANLDALLPSILDKAFKGEL